MAPKNGRQYENIEAELAHDIGVIEEKLEHQGDVQNQHSGMLTSILSKLDKQEIACKRAHDDFATDHVFPAVSKTIEAAVKPEAIARNWGSNPLVWAVITMVLLIVGAVEEWVRYTYNVSNENRTRIRVIETTVERIPAQMIEQNAKIDKILAFTRRRPASRDVNP